MFYCFMIICIKILKCIEILMLLVEFYWFFLIDGSILKYEVDGSVVLVEFFLFWLFYRFVLNNGWKDE